MVFIIYIAACSSHYLESGVPIETEEMLPQWFDVDHIPFEKMWKVIQYLFSAIWAHHCVY
jgi:hypothetical protein